LWDVVKIGLGVLVKITCPGSHYKVIAVETVDPVCPPGNRHFAPFGQEGGMVVFRLGKIPDLIGKFQGIYKILELKNTLQPFLIVFFNQRPIG
jgi:hypothetical protein